MGIEVCTLFITNRNETEKHETKMQVKPKERKPFLVVRQDLATSSSWAAYLGPHHCTPHHHMAERLVDKDVTAARRGWRVDDTPPHTHHHRHKNMSHHSHPSSAVD